MLPVSRYLCRAVFAGMAALAGALPAVAHHSFSMFDNTKTTSVLATVAKVEWSNPHVWFWAYVRNSKGAHDLYGFEAGSIGVLARAGWSLDTLKVGDRVSIAYHPLRDGRNGGNFMSATFADGSRTPDVTIAGGPPGPPGPPGGGGPPGDARAPLGGRSP